MRLRRGQDHIAAAVPGQPPHPQQRAKRAAIDEVERRHVDDHQAASRYHSRDRRLSVRRPGNVQLSAHGHDSMTVTYASCQLHAWHKGRLPARQPGRGPDQRLISWICIFTLRRRHKIRPRAAAPCRSLARPDLHPGSAVPVPLSPGRAGYPEDTPPRRPIPPRTSRSLELPRPGISLTGGWGIRP